jgi:N-acetylglucosamine-6-phosphate deacetylase
VEVEVTPDRGVRRTSDDCLSGSALTHQTAFRNAIRKFGQSVGAASHLCSRTPARVLGLGKKGYLAAGMDADVVLLDNDLELRATIVGGKIGFQV